MEPVLIEDHGAVRVITINRPARRNAVNAVTAAALRDAWLALEADDSVRVGVLTGGDDVFCAGADLTDIEGLAAELEGPNGPLGFTRLPVRKPTIAAVAGYAVAGGLELACWCDLRIADESAIFGCFERRFGVPLVDGGTQRLPRIVGLGRALDMILTGRAVDAAEAHVIGLANEVVARGQHVRHAIELGQQLAELPQICMLNDRQAVYDGLGQDLPSGLRLEAGLGMDTIRSGESSAGAMRFMRGDGRSGT